jgi:hypothetical protein
MHELFSAQLADARLADRLRLDMNRQRGTARTGLWRVRLGEGLVQLGERVAGVQTAPTAAPSAAFTYC